MGITNNFTRGGQLAMHKLRMLKQISIVSFVFCFLGAGCFTFYEIYNKTNQYQWYILKEYAYADLTTSMSLRPQMVTQVFKSKMGVTKRVKSVALMNDPFVLSTVERMKSILWDIILGSCVAALITIIATVAFFILRGKHKIKSVTKRGASIATKKEMIKLIKRRSEKSDLMLDDIPLIKNMETSHMLITGTTGTGKSNSINTLLPQIRNRGDRAVVVDLNGEYVSRFYDPQVDLLLNPFDIRTLNWDLWAECVTSTHYDALAESIIPEQSSSTDKFWDNASRKVLATAIKKMHDEPDRSLKRLYQLLCLADAQTYEAYFKGTLAAAFTTRDGDKMSISVRASLQSHIAFFEHVGEESPQLSIRNWVRQESQYSQKGWLFLTSMPDQRATLRPLITAFSDVAINALMSLDPNPERRLWFVVDELAALHKLSTLEIALAESRKYGGCVLAGIQNIEQLSKIYGRHSAKSILDLFNTSIIFRGQDPDTNQWISKKLGEAEISETQENLSYGANTIRDGISLNAQEKQKQIVLATEIAALENLEYYLKLPGSYPVCKSKMTYKTRPLIQPAFIIKYKKTIHSDSVVHGGKTKKMQPEKKILKLPPVFNETPLF